MLWRGLSFKLFEPRVGFVVKKREIGMKSKREELPKDEETQTFDDPLKDEETQTPEIKRRKFEFSLDINENEPICKPVIQTSSLTQDLQFSSLFSILFYEFQDKKFKLNFNDDLKN